MRIVDTTRVGRLKPGPGELAGKGNGICKCAAGDPRINRGMNELRNRPHRGRPVEQILMRDDLLRFDGNVVEQGRTAACRALAEA